MNITDKLANINKVIMTQPQLSSTERAAYEQIRARLHRAQGRRRSAKKYGDAAKLAAAERAVARAEEARAAFVLPHVDHLWAPTRIVAKFESHWGGPGVAGVHLQECEMVLDHKDLSGPSYRTARVLKDEGGPPTNPRSAPDIMGVAWFAIREQIERGKIVVIETQPADPTLAQPKVAS
jgi:hypothetical protein